MNNKILRDVIIHALVEELKVSATSVEVVMYPPADVAHVTVNSESFVVLPQETDDLLNPLESDAPELVGYLKPKYIFLYHCQEDDLVSYRLVNVYMGLSWDVGQKRAYDGELLYTLVCEKYKIGYYLNCPDE